MRKTPKWMGLIWLMWAGCSQPANTRADEIEGTPPPPSEDPFFFVAIPADAVAADTTGKIEMPAKPAEVSENVDTTVTIPEEPAAVTTTPEPHGVESKALPLPQEEPPRYACFSCVQICMVENDQTRCGDREDTICGWGVHPERHTAASLAEAECEGALDIARESVRFARIEGSCPIATCEAQ